MNNLDFQHVQDANFRNLVDALPRNVQSKVPKQFEYLMTVVLPPSLRFKKVAGRWSIRIDRNYRALGKEINGTISWYWVGHKNEVDKILKS